MAWDTAGQVHREKILAASHIPTTTNRWTEAREGGPGKEEKHQRGRQLTLGAGRPPRRWVHLVSVATAALYPALGSSAGPGTLGGGAGLAGRGAWAGRQGPTEGPQTCLSHEWVNERRILTIATLPKSVPEVTRSRGGASPLPGAPPARGAAAGPPRLREAAEPGLGLTPRTLPGS